MKLDKVKCQILYLGCCHSGHGCRLGDKQLECSPGERDLWVWLMVSSLQDNSVPWWPKRLALPWGALGMVQLRGGKRWLSHSTQHWCSFTSSNGCSFGVNGVREIRKSIRMCSKMGNEDSKRTRGHNLWGEAEDTSLLIPQCREDETERWPGCCLHLLHQVEQKGRC